MGWDALGRGDVRAASFATDVSYGHRTKPVQLQEKHELYSAGPGFGIRWCGVGIRRSTCARLP